MATHLTTDEMKVFVRQRFEDFVNNRQAEVIRHNMTPDFYDHDGPGGQAAGVAAAGLRVTCGENKVSHRAMSSLLLRLHGRAVGGEDDGGGGLRGEGGGAAVTSVPQGLAQ